MLDANLPLYNLVWAIGILILLRFAGFPSSGAANCTLWNNTWKCNLNVMWWFRTWKPNQLLPKLTLKPKSFQEYKNKAVCMRKSNRTEQRASQFAPTLALEVVSRCCEQQPVHHGVRPAAAGYPGLFVPCLHPLGKPAEVAITMQRVGT